MRGYRSARHRVRVIGDAKGANQRGAYQLLYQRALALACRPPPKKQKTKVSQEGQGRHHGTWHVAVAAGCRVVLVLPPPPPTALEARAARRLPRATSQCAVRLVLLLVATSHWHCQLPAASSHRQCVLRTPPSVKESVQTKQTHCGLKLRLV
jgi:hypothetical protein